MVSFGIYRELNGRAGSSLLGKTFRVRLPTRGNLIWQSHSKITDVKSRLQLESTMHQIRSI